MINEISSLLFLIVWFIYVSLVFLVPSFLINKHQFLSSTVKTIFQSLVSNQLKNGFNPNIYYTNNIEQSENKVDIVICNHVSTIDWEIILTIFNHFGIHNYMMVGKKELIYFPGFGFHFMVDNHIKLARNWEEDKQTISNQIDKINNGVIFIFPEGTRFEPKKRDDGQKYAKENKLPNYDYLLVPKSKGFWTFYNLLKEKNKMGKIYDMTIVMQNFVGETAYLSDLTSKKTGNIFVINRELEHPELYIENNDFKKWLLNEWKTKDNLIKMYQKLIYQKMDIIVNKDHLFQSIIFMVIISWLLYQKKEFRYYMVISMILSILIVKFKKL
jgi:1-acyl-sn-glycerol-3-phosphate acyltransferase